MVIVANRDEFFERPSSPAAFWSDHSEIFAGRDLQEGGTWMGVSRTGRIAALTNWTEDTTHPQADLSRGKLVAEFLRTNESSTEFVESIERQRYRGFNLVVYDGDTLIYCSNRTEKPRTLNPGIYGLSNTKLGNRWIRVVKGERRLANHIKEPDPEQLIDMLFDPRQLPFKPSTNFSNEDCFIMGETYGTRATTALLLGHTDVKVREQTYGPMGKRQGCIEETFTLQSVVP